jgi:hypothetical protein
VVYIGKTANSTDDKCPTKNAERNATSNICECLVGYKATNENRQCGSSFFLSEYKYSISIKYFRNQIIFRFLSIILQF